MSINLTTKYREGLEKAFTHGSFVKSNCGGNVDFVGAKTVRIYSLLPTNEVDFTRNADKPFGTRNVIQDTVQELTMTQDKAFNGSVDKGDESDQAITNKAGQWLKIQMNEVCTPNADKYAFKQMAKLGHVAGVAEPTKSTVLGMVSDAQVYFDDHLVPMDGRILYMPAKYVAMIVSSDEYTKLDTLGSKAIPKGAVGELFGFQIVRIPAGYLPADCYFIATYKQAVAFPYKINDAKIYTDAPDISGAVIQGRHYYDVFVFEKKADGIYAAVKTASKQAAPTVAVSNSSATITSTGATAIWYTTDGTDPRFSMTKEVYSAAFAVPTGCTKIRAVAFGTFTSDITDKDIT